MSKTSHYFYSAKMLKMTQLEPPKVHGFPVNTPICLIVPIHAFAGGRGKVPTQFESIAKIHF